MNRTILIVLSLTAVVGFHCSDSFEPATSLGQDVLGITPGDQFAHFSGTLPVGEPGSFLDRGAGSGTDRIPGLHRSEHWLAVGNFSGKHGSESLGTVERCAAYVEFDAGGMHEILADTQKYTMDSMVIVFTRHSLDTTIDSTYQTRLFVALMRERKEPLSLLSPDASPSSFADSATPIGDSMQVRATFGFDSASPDLRTKLRDELIKEETRERKLPFVNANLSDTLFYLPVFVGSEGDSLMLLGSNRGSTPPRIDLHYHETAVDTVPLKKSLPAFYSDFSVVESATDTDSLGTMAYSSAAPGRFTVIPLALASLWEGMYDSSTAVRYRGILAASLEIGVADARWYRDSLTFAYHLDTRPNLDLMVQDSLVRLATHFDSGIDARGDDEISRTLERLSELLPVTVRPGTKVRLSVADLLFGMMTGSGSPPDTAYLYLTLPPTDRFGSIRWQVGAKMKLKATFSNPHQEQ